MVSHESRIGGQRLSPEQIRSLLEVSQRLRAASHPRDFLEGLVGLVSDVVKTKVAVAGRHGNQWVLGAESRPTPPIPLLRDGDVHALDKVSALPGFRVELWKGPERNWTLVGLATVPNPAVLILEGDWTAGAGSLKEMARGLSDVSAQPRRAATGSVDEIARQMTRALADTAGMSSVGEVVLHYIVKVVPSGMASLAVAGSDGELAIVATHGYPRALVEHLKISPGSGVIGAVQSSRLPMVVPDVRMTPGLDRHRARYRTESFAALPIVAGAESLGVVCLTDRLIPGPFTQDDITALSPLLAPAALALGRERVWQEAQAYAQAAVIDPVSGLFNRRYFQARLDEELQRAIRQTTSVGLLMVDLDGFKIVNDRFGHVAGDLVIRDISEILRRSVRIFDVCTRFGGEEFAVMMPGGTDESAGAIAERIRQRVEAYHRTEPEFVELKVTASIGVAVSPPGTTSRDLIERADRALYHAKKSGKNRVSTAGPDGSVWS